MNKELYLSSVRAKMGDWIYYTCVMSLNDVASRVKYAEDLHKNTELSKLIQRVLEEKRINGIKDYLISDQERFFGSLVVAVYGGNPSWSSLDISGRGDSDFDKLQEHHGANLGFLSFDGTEKLFALDGQHRLAGIKAAIKEKEEIGNDFITVVFVGHKNSDEGLRRTRKLFTTLNKHAKPVSKSEIIALDENDAVAIVVRKLLEENDMFFGKSISYAKGNSIPKHEVIAFTNITNLYDVLCIYLGEIVEKKSKHHWKNQLRPLDSKIDELYKRSTEVFDDLRKEFPEMDEYFSSDFQLRSAKKYRGEHGGSLVFRPIGLLILFEIMSKLSKEGFSYKESMKKIGNIPNDISKIPYRDILWSHSSKKMMNANKVVMRDILIYKITGLGNRPELESKINKINDSLDCEKYLEPFC